MDRSDLQRLADQINEFTATDDVESTIVVRASVYPTLAFDHGHVVTPDELMTSLHDAFMRYAPKLEPASLIDSADIEDITRSKPDPSRALQHKIDRLSTALANAMEIVEATAIDRAMYGMEVEDEDHPWHENVKRIRTLCPEYREE